MTAAAMLRHARDEAELTQSGLATRACTSQTAISAYESGTKVPSVDTLSRLLAAAGMRLALEVASAAVVQRSQGDMKEAGRRLAEVLALAEALPSRPGRTLRYPVLSTSSL